MSAYFAMVVAVYCGDDDPDRAHEYVSEHLRLHGMFVGEPWEVYELSRDANGDVFSTDHCIGQRESVKA